VTFLFIFIHNKYGNSVVNPSLNMGYRYASRLFGSPSCKCYCIVFVFCQL